MCIVCNCSLDDNYTCLYWFTDIDECAENPCQNDGTCMDLVNSYTCICASCYSGDHCEER